MNTRLITALAVSLALTVALPGTALPAPNDAGAGSGLAVRAPADHEEAFLQALDSRGQPIGEPVRIDREGDQPDAAAAVLSVPVAARVGPSSSGSRALLASGCYTAWVTRSRSGYFGETLWKYTHEKRYCWTSPRLTSVQPQVTTCCVDPFWRWRGTIASNGYFFTWSGDAKGGHYSFRQGRFDQVVAGHVTASAYPWIKIWAYGNGSFSYATDIS
jgi:hypothetical protein